MRQQTAIKQLEGEMNEIETEMKLASRCNLLIVKYRRQRRKSSNSIGQWAACTTHSSVTSPPSTPFASSRTVSTRRRASSTRCWQRMPNCARISNTCAHNAACLTPFTSDCSRTSCQRSVSSWN